MKLKTKKSLLILATAMFVCSGVFGQDEEAGTSNPPKIEVTNKSKYDITLNINDSMDTASILNNRYRLIELSILAGELKEVTEGVFDMSRPVLSIKPFITSMSMEGQELQFFSHYYNNGAPNVADRKLVNVEVLEGGRPIDSFKVVSTIQDKTLEIIIYDSSKNQCE